MQFVPWTCVSLEGGFWKSRQDRVLKNTVHVIYERFKETGRIDAMKLQWKDGMPNTPHVFWDSDVAKWMEGTAYLLCLKDEPLLRSRLEKIIEYIEKGQDRDGYFNSAFLTLFPHKKFTDRTAHELYTAGHLIEAAVAHYYATGEEHFLKAMCRFADFIERVFVTEKSTGFATSGHEEIELALIRLAEATGEKRYLELSRYFVETRGRIPVERVFSVPNGTFPASPPVDNHLLYDDTYAQDNAPARELPEAAGHAVRAMYYYSAMADLAREYGDEGLFRTVERLWNDCVYKKMYITGGISAERYGEAIGAPYVLPNDYAYAETCASVAMVNFSQRMFRLDPDRKYTDMIELQMYNGALSGISIDGSSFFYDNALRSRPAVNAFFKKINARPLLPPGQRQRLFECSCCPPNIYRFLASLGQYFYSVYGTVVFIHQYGTGSGDINIGENRYRITQKTNYPWDETVSVVIEGEGYFTVALRIPAWCEDPAIKRNGLLLEEPEINKGYAYIPGPWNKGDVISIRFPMRVMQIAANPKVVNVSGKIALMRGPLVYCLESHDNRFNIFDLTLPREARIFEEADLEIAGLTVKAIKGRGLLHPASDWEDRLYQPYSSDWEEMDFIAIPYFAWANRGSADMTVWIGKGL